MSRIYTNLPSLLSALYMERNMQALNRSLERLATGIQINSARDDPGGIITTDALRGELTGIQSAITNAERANNLMATAEGSIEGISDLLLDIQATIFEVAGDGALTDEEIEAKQLEIDSNIEAINQLVQSASFAGQKLLDGSLGYQTSGVDAAAITDLAIHKAPVGSTTGEVAVMADLLVAAERGSLIFPNAALAGDVTVRFTGPGGSEMFEFATGTTSTDVMTAINSQSEMTGLIAELVNGDPLQGVRIMTSEYGSAATVRVEVTEGNPADFALQDELGAPASADSGVDIQMNINNSLVVGQGLRCHYASASIDLEMYIAEAWNAAGPPASTGFEITSGGALFQIGQQIGADQQVSIGIPALDSSNLGRSTIGYLSDIASGGTLSLKSGQLSAISAIVEEAAQQISAIRPRIGSFQNNTLAMAINNLKRTEENVSAARSALLDTDYAAEAARVTQQEILVEAARAAAAMAQQMPRYVLRLLMDA